MADLKQGLRYRNLPCGIKVPHAVVCSVRLCAKPPQGPSPSTCLPLCRQHLQNDLRKCAEAETKLTAKIAHFKKFQQPLRLMQQRLASDLQLLDESFHELRETIDKYQAELTAAVNKHHDQIMDSLNILSELDSFENELEVAKDAKDSRLAFTLTEGMRESLENFGISSKLVRFDESAKEVTMTAFPDATSDVRDLKACTERLLFERVARVENFDADHACKLKTSHTQLRLNGEAQCMALCTNTNGYSLSGPKRILKNQDASSATRMLPNPMVFVAIRRKLKQHHDGKELASTISMISIEHKITGYLKFSWDLDQPIRDLHCDSDRQMLYIAQHNAVIVTDLSGELKSKVTVSNLRRYAQIMSVRCITGDSDKLFLLTEMSSGGPSVFGLSKESLEIQLTLPLPDDCNLALDSSTRIGVQNRMLLLSDYADVFTLCSITGLIVGKESVKQLNGLPELSIEKPEDLYRCATHRDPLPRASTLVSWPLDSSKYLKFSIRDNVCIVLEKEEGNLIAVKTSIG